MKHPENEAVKELVTEVRKLVTGTLGEKFLACNRRIEELETDLQSLINQRAALSKVISEIEQPMYGEEESEGSNENNEY